MSTTTNLALNEPAYNSTSPTWDQPLNYNATILDQMFGNTTGVSVSTSGTSTYTNITAPSSVAAGSTSQAMRFNLTGALAANQTVLLPQGVAGMWVVSNNTTNAFTVTLGSNNGSNVSAGTTVLCPQNFSIIVYCDGANVKKADDGLITTPISVANGGTGLNSLAANNVILGNGTSAVQTVAPGSSGNILTSNGTTWASTAPTAGGGALIRAPQILTSGTSYTTPAGCNNIYVEVVGGGGGGQSGVVGNTGSGGGGGGYSSRYFSVTPSTAYTYAIGSGGGVNSNGGNSTFTVSGVTITGNGGSYPGIGGTASGGTMNSSGQGGGGYASNQANGQGGNGGSSMFGGGAVGGAGASSGANASGYGGGGGGGGANGSAGGSGGSGFQGVIRITEYT